MGDVEVLAEGKEPRVEVSGCHGFGMVVVGLVGVVRVLLVDAFVLVEEGVEVA